MTEPRWTDDRLADAYRDRFAQRPPDGLASATIGAVRAGGRPRRPRAAPGWAAAAAAVVVMSMGIGLALVRPSAPDATEPSSSPPATGRPVTAAPSTGSTSGPTSGPHGFPGEVLGLPVISVSEAVAQRDADLTDTEIAVRGYLPARPPLPPSCLGVVVPPSPLEPSCPDFLVSWLMERPETLWRVMPDGMEGGPPLGPALQPKIGPEVPRAVASGVEPDYNEPVPVVLVGHFDDHRAGLCPDDAEHECRRRFVVDARVWVDGRDAGLHPVLPDAMAEPIRSVEEVVAIAGGAQTMRADPWVALLDRDQLRAVDPRAADVPFLRDGRYVWVVRHLTVASGRVVARTQFVVNDSGALFAAAADGITQAAATIPDPTHEPFPEQVVGLPVWSVAQVIEKRDGGSLADRAVAVRGYFLVPPPELACPGVRDDVEPVPPSDRTCPEHGRLWLMGDNERPWAIVEGIRRWRRPSLPAVNLFVGPEVPFNRVTDFDDAREPVIEPIVILGHFGDPRSRTALESQSLYVDAIAWADGRPEPNDVHHLDLIAREDRPDVERRIDAHAGPSIASWATVLSGQRLAEILPEVGSTELESADLVWRVRRLVTERGAPYVRTAYTVDGGRRVWLDEAYGGLSLQPTHSIALRNGVRFEVTDGPDLVTGVRLAEGADPPEAIVTAGNEGFPSLTLSNPAGDVRELRISWTGTRCETGWEFGLWWHETGAGAVPRSVILGYRDERCPDSDLRHSVILTLSEPMPAGEVVAIESLSGG